MCLQDFQMARRSVAVPHQATSADLALPANPLRLRVIVCGRNMQVDVYAAADASDGSKAIAVVGTKSAGVGDSYGQQFVMRVEDFGTALMGDLFFHRVEATGIVTVLEVLALPQLDNLITGGK